MNDMDSSLKPSLSEYGYTVNSGLWAGAGIRDDIQGAFSEFPRPIRRAAMGDGPPNWAPPRASQNFTQVNRQTTGRREVNIPEISL